MATGKNVKIQAPPRLEEHELSAWRGMLRAHAAVTRALDAELRAAHGLSVSSYEVLMFLADAEGRQLRMSDISRHLLLSRSGLTRLIDRLVDRGLVTRCADEDDGRGSLARLTPAGAELIAEARRTHLDGVRRHFLDRLSADEQRAMGASFTRITGAAPSAK